MVIKSFFTKYKKLYWEVDKFKFGNFTYTIDEIDMMGKLCNAEDILEGLRNGLTYKEIAKEYHMSESTVYRRLKKLFEACIDNVVTI